MGAAVKITRIEHTPAALRTLAVRCVQADQARRMLAIAMVMEGMGRADTARLAGMDRQTLRDWVHRYNEAGLTGLASRGAAWPDTETDGRADGGAARGGCGWS